MTSVRKALVVLAVLLIVLVVALPNTALAWLRSEIGWLGRSVNWVEGLWPEWDTVHLLMFGALGTLARLALPPIPVARLLAGLVVFSGTSEVLQFWAPGRTPRWSDAAQNVLGSVAGVVLAMLLMALTERLHRRPAREGNSAP